MTKSFTRYFIAEKHEYFHGDYRSPTQSIYQHDKKEATENEK